MEKRKSLFDVVDDVFEKPKAEIRKGKVHYLRFDDSPMPLGELGKKLLGKEEIIPSEDGWIEVSSFLGVTNSKKMVQKLIALAIIANRRETVEKLLSKQRQEKPKEEEETKEG